ncbi:MAG: hypothetical protein NTW15_03495 [Burkholderiales bacterium]|nr:hypothetical protein [Burkholderiales bacterium]
MRRVLMMLLVVLLPFNGWAGVASLRCLHEAAGGAAVAFGHAGQGGHAHRGDAVAHVTPAVHAEQVALALHADGADHAGHAGHAGHSDHSYHSDHSDRHRVAHGDRVTHADADAAAEVDATASAADGVDCAHADCSGCCHASGSVAVGFARLLAVGAAVGGVHAAVADVSPDSPALDGPFRPPRTASA